VRGSWRGFDGNVEVATRDRAPVHRATTKYFSNSFIFKNKTEKEGPPRDSPAGLGAGGPEFKSQRPDYLILYYQ
jgi:hypothetical protein